MHADPLSQDGATGWLSLRFVCCYSAVLLKQVINVYFQVASMTQQHCCPCNSRAGARAIYFVPSCNQQDWWLTDKEEEGEEEDYPLLQGDQHCMRQGRGQRVADSS